MVESTCQITAVDTYRVQILPLNVGAADLIAASDLNEGIGFAAFVSRGKTHCAYHNNVQHIEPQPLPAR